MLADLRQRQPHPGVQLGHQGRHVRAELRAGRAQRIGGLQPVAALYPTPTLRALANLNLEVPHDRFDLRHVLLILRRHAGHRDRAAAVRTRRRNRRRMRLVNPCRPPAAAMRAVIGAGPPARKPAASLRPVLGEGGRLSLAGPPGSVELLLQVLAVMLPVIPLLDQLRVLVFEVLDAHVPRIRLTRRPVRTAALVVHQNHAPLIGTRTPILHPDPADFSPRPLNEDPRCLGASFCWLTRPLVPAV